MSPNVVARPNLPPALRTLIGEAIGEASMQWENIDQAGIFKATEAARIVDDVERAVERAWDAREAPLFAHLRSLSYAIAQLRERFDTDQVTASPYLYDARRAVDNIREMLEAPR